jgi:GrpB-like predicted nucleotidyltransferase (UPF0157 family)
MLGLPKGIVKLEPHSEQWRQLFAEEATRIREVVGEYVLAIEHVGSTSINGIAAKPIIDMAVSVEKATDGEMMRRTARKYRLRISRRTRHRGAFLFRQRRAAHASFASGFSHSDFWRSHLLFRDYLRENPIGCERIRKIKAGFG